MARQQSTKYRKTNNATKSPVNNSNNDSSTPTKNNSLLSYFKPSPQKQHDIDGQNHRLHAHSLEEVKEVT